MGLKELARRSGLVGGLTATAIVVAGVGGAAALTLPTLPTTTSSSSSSATTQSKSSNGSAGKGSAAGKPTAQSDLLCGTFTPGSDRISGGSDIDHPSGGSATGSVYPYTGQSCENPGSSSGSTFMWTLTHSNVNVNSERGTEHGEFLLSSTSYEAGFDGHITNYDFTTPLTAAAPDPCSDGSGRETYYASGHAYDACGAPGGPGNFNTHGGAQLGQHYRGNYGTLVYQDTNNNMSSCQSGSQTYCFEAVLEGQTN